MSDKSPQGTAIHFAISPTPPQPPAKDPDIVEVLRRLHRLERQMEEISKHVIPNVEEHEDRLDEHGHRLDSHDAAISRLTEISDRLTSSSTARGLVIESIDKSLLAIDARLSSIMDAVKNK